MSSPQRCRIRIFAVSVTEGVHQSAVFQYAFSLRLRSGAPQCLSAPRSRISRPVCCDADHQRDEAKEGDDDRPTASCGKRRISKCLGMPDNNEDAEEEDKNEELDVGTINFFPCGMITIRHHPKYKGRLVACNSKR